MPSPRIGLSIVACGIVLLLVPGPADAATYCVHAAPADCTGQIDQGLNLQAALDAAGASTADDTIDIRPGTYNQGGPELAYFQPESRGELHIVGSGPSTILKRADGNNVTTFSEYSVDAVSIANLTIEVPNGSSPTQNVGLLMTKASLPVAGPAPVADGVTLTLPETPNPGGTYLGAFIDRATFRNGTVTDPSPAPGYSATGVSSKNGLVENSTFNIDSAITMTAGGTARGIDAISRKGFDLLGTTAGPGTFTVEDSLWRPTPGAVNPLGMSLNCGNQGTQATLRNSTFVAPPGSGSLATVNCAGGFTSRLDVDSSILLGGALSILTSTSAGTVTAEVNYSDFDPATVQQQAGTTLTQGVGNVNVAPAFAGVEDFRLTGSNPLLIDGGNPAGLAPGESATDLAGAPRIVGRRDIGAYEFQTPAAVPPGTPPSVTPPPAVTPVAKCKKKKRRASAGKKKKCKKKGKKGSGKK